MKKKAHAFQGDPHKHVCLSNLVDFFYYLSRAICARDPPKNNVGDEGTKLGIEK